jgi:hypothetical protein
MFTKIIQVPKVVFDKDILKVGQKVKLYKGECNLINGEEIWEEEYECVIDGFQYDGDVIKLVDIESYGSCENHEVFYVDAEDIQSGLYRKIELMED